jgi:hypothetical protein
MEDELEGKIEVGRHVWWMGPEFGGERGKKELSLDLDGQKG